MRKSKREGDTEREVQRSFAIGGGSGIVDQLDYDNRWTASVY